EAAGFDQRLNKLLDEERISLRPFAHELRQAVERGVATQQAGEQLLDRLAAERGEGDLPVEGLRHPGGLILGAEVDDRQALRPLDRLYLVGEEGLAGRVEPVQVFVEVDSRLAR